MSAEPNRWVGLIFISLAVSIIIVDGTIVNVSLPPIVGELNISSGGYSSARVRKKRRTRSRTLTGGGSL